MTQDSDEQITMTRAGDTLPAPRAGGPTRLKLRLDDGREEILDRPLRLGSAADNDVVIDDGYVSAHHCSIARQGLRWLLVDSGSRNGTMLGGVRVERAEIHSGVRLLIGRTGLRVMAVDPERVEEMIGRGAAMERLRSEISRVAPTRARVLLLGESGTGKELVARALHQASGRRGPFIALNCGAVAAGLEESELFGHERGAFTGAISRRVGAFEEADGGTLFLDEVGELPAPLQAKLLRTLEDGKIRPVGAQGERKIDARVVSATHRDLAVAVAQQQFRLDLYHRLATIELRLPPLRERKDDIPMLASHFLEEMSEEVGPKSFSPQAMTTLVAHPWPGNVRELRNAVQRGAILGATVLEPADLLPRREVVGATVPYEQPWTPPARLDELEREAIERALRRTRGNRRAAALELGMPKSTLCDRVRRYGIKVDDL